MRDEHGQSLAMNWDEASEWETGRGPTGTTGSIGRDPVANRQNGMDPFGDDTHL